MYHKVRIYAIYIISFFTVLAIFVSGCFISGCKRSNYDAKFTSSTPDATTAPMLSWDAPATYTDGNALVVKEYRVYFSTLPSSYSTGNYYPVSAPATSVKVKDIISLGTGTYYFVVTAVDSAGRESNPSNEVTRYLY